MSDLFTTLTGIAFWTILLAACTAVFGATIVSIARARLDRRTRTRWIWLVVLAPGFGILLWFATGRRTASSPR